MVEASPRIFVGTLASGESEFDECAAAVNAQTGVQVTHHVIANQPEHAAHGQLWTAWENAKAECDLFVKIDADTILNRETALFEIYSLFARDPDVTGAQIMLHDYFTDGLISGMNAFSPSVVFMPSKSRLFADHADGNHRKVLKGESVLHLAPIGWHGKNPGPEQAFHFGLRRKLKNHRDILQKTAAAWTRIGGEGRGWALAGAASARWWMRGHTNYDSRMFRHAFARMRDDAARNDAIQKFIGTL